MQPGTEFPPEKQTPDGRYLRADEYYSDDAIKTLQADCVRQHQNREKGAAYERFVNWTRQVNEMLVFTGNAYADLVIPHRFDCIFRLANPREHVLTGYELTQSMLVLGRIGTFDSVEHGHKHLCVLTFEQGIPAILELLHQEDGTYCTPHTDREVLGLCMACDLPAITERHEKVEQLRAQYGAKWWEHDELSN
jgi:hypothetical protein